ncbi:hypothetical protein ACIGXI_05680 [Kitasatospora aureofaciens]|uniref:hypothetical protein n=1 Tax=Kitasatospora aureofaciens TaxID=1894 RepID=UPI0037CC2F67
MDPAVGVVLGALIGAGGTVITTVSAARTARATIRAQGEVQKSQWLDDSRREAYTEFLSAATTLHGSWWTLAEAINDSSCGDDDRQVLIAKSYELWKALQRAFAVVQIMGPEDVTKQAKAVFETLTSMDNSGASWCDKARNGDEEAAEKRRQDFLTAHAEYDVTAFASAASGALSGGRGKAKP